MVYIQLRGPVPKISVYRLKICSQTLLFPGPFFTHRVGAGASFTSPSNTPSQAPVDDYCPFLPLVVLAEMESNALKALAICLTLLVRSAKYNISIILHTTKGIYIPPGIMIQKKFMRK